MGGSPVHRSSDVEELLIRPVETEPEDHACSVRAPEVGHAVHVAVRRLDKMAGAFGPVVGAAREIVQYRDLAGWRHAVQVEIRAAVEIAVGCQEQSSRRNVSGAGQEQPGDCAGRAYLVNPELPVADRGRAVEIAVIAGGQGAGAAPVPAIYAVRVCVAEIVDFLELACLADLENSPCPVQAATGGCSVKIPVRALG